MATSGNGSGRNDDDTDPDITPVRTEACGRCGQVAVIVERWEWPSNLTDFCSRAADGRWGCCIGRPGDKPRKLVLVSYPDGQ